jgi:hypothetical protein
MATLIDFSQLHTRVNHYKNSFLCETLSRAFAYVILEALLNLSPEEMEDAITDGSQDRGLDAVFVDDHDGKNVIHLFQFKYVEDFGKATLNFPSNEIDKIISIISDILIKKKQYNKR